MQATHLHLLRGKGRNFFLDILFHRMSAIAINANSKSSTFIHFAYVESSGWTIADAVCRTPGKSG